MAARHLIILEHASKLGEAPSHVLLEAVSIRRRNGAEVPRSYADYEVVIDEGIIPAGKVTMSRPLARAHRASGNDLAHHRQAPD